MQPLLADLNPQTLAVTAVIGIVAGALARFLIPGKQSMNLILTMVLGIVGAYVGGYLKGATNFGGDELGWTIGWSTAGAIVVLLGVMLIQRIFHK
jgi:uncharacterized membrane protein YeaQ/YmgE (transglycosylase-associated protein family)